MDRVKLSYKSFKELDLLRLSIENNPDNKASGFYKYTRQARRKLDLLAWAVTNKMARGEE